MDVLKQVLGRLHPIIVHLPIGFIIFGLFLQWYDRKLQEYEKVIALAYLWGGIGAIFACITGYLQYLDEGYAFDTVKWHLWAGIITALFSIFMYAKLNTGLLSKMPMKVYPWLLFSLVAFTGHQGGNITHGSNYLIQPLPNNIKSAMGFETFEEKEIALSEENWRETLLYEDVIKPILNNKCVSCHGPKKAKGELVLHTEEGILKGGENGEIISKNDPENSELYSRLILPIDDEGHMPPKDKSQLEKEEIELIKVWIAEGNPFNKTIHEVGLEKVLFVSFFPQKIDNDHPDFEIGAASVDSIAKIEKQGVHIDRISAATNFLSVSCINKPSFTDSDFELLSPIADQIAQLNLGGTKITDNIVEKLAGLQNLTILKLDDTQITGIAIASLSNLKYLKSINLTGSKFKEKYLKDLTGFKNLQKIYLYNTHVNAKEVQTLKGKITIDYGNYQLPPIPSDTIVY